MLTNWKIFTGIALSLLLSAIPLAPVKAQTDTPTQMQDNGTNAPTRMQDHGQTNSSERMRGTIVSVVGSVITVQLENGKTETVSTATHIQTWNLREGMDVYVDANGMIVDMAPPVAENTQTGDFNSRTSTLLQQLNHEETTTVSPRREETTQTQPAPVPERTYEAPAPEPQQPVRALW